MIYKIDIWRNLRTDLTVPFQALELTLSFIFYKKV